MTEQTFSFEVSFWSSNAWWPTSATAASGALSLATAVSPWASSTSSPVPSTSRVIVLPVRVLTLQLSCRKHGHVTIWCITMTCCQSHKFMSCSLGIGRRSAWLQKPQGWRRVLEPISLTKRSWEAVSHARYHVLTPLPHPSACLQLETIFSMSCDPWYCAQ